MKRFGSKTNSLCVAALILVTSAAGLQAGRNYSDVDRAIVVANRASDTLVENTLQVLRYQRVRNVRDHQAYRAAKNLDNNVERLRSAWGDGANPRYVLAKIGDINRDLAKFEHTVNRYRMTRSVTRSLNWMRSSVADLNSHVHRHGNRRGDHRDPRYGRDDDRGRDHDRGRGLHSHGAPQQGRVSQSTERRSYTWH